uniref:Uncharacterized protein n=1 Tax=Cacopsylla melanoneura TaxID=428564 RepID=A0A8D8LZC7_9HEMI
MSFYSMKTVSCKKKLNVVNFDLLTENKQRKRHGVLFPDTVRGLIIGPSGVGKTNLLLSLLIHPNGLRFENIYIYSKSTNQPKYQLLDKIMNGIKEVSYIVFTNNEDVIQPCEAKRNSVFIFDDVICEKQQNIKEYFARGRHYACDTFFLAQTYSAVSKQLIRDNTNFLCIFQQDLRNLKHIFNDHVTDISFEKFKEMCQHCWKSSKHGFIVIDKESNLQNGRYRNGLDSFFIDIK